ncbi:MAG: diguanylate cyclase, partial [Actinomycetota bacterium]
MRLSRLTLTMKFAAASAVLMALIGALLVHEVRDQVRSRSLASASRAAELVAATTVDPELSAAQLQRPLNAAEIGIIDRDFNGGLRRLGVEELVLYDARGRVLYANEHDEIGHVVAPEGHLGEAIEGRIQAEITTHAHVGVDEGSERLLEAYVPVTLAGQARPAGVLELYLPFAPYEKAANADIRRLTGLLVVGLAMLWLALFRVVSRASRTLTRQRDENKHLAQHDPLTGLANRALFADRTSQALRTAERKSERAAILLMDLDRFKEVNDTLGHHSGDALLMQAAERLRGTLRGIDTVARLGGDEFAVLLPEGDETAARAAAARIQLAFEDT